MKSSDTSASTNQNINMVINISTQIKQKTERSPHLLADIVDEYRCKAFAVNLQKVFVANQLSCGQQNKEAG